MPACLASNDATWNGPEDRTKPGQSSITRRTWTDRDLQLGQSTLRAAAREEGPPALLPLGGFQWWVPRQLNSQSRLKRHLLALWVLLETRRWEARRVSSRTWALTKPPSHFTMSGSETWMIERNSATEKNFMRGAAGPRL